MNLWKSLCFPFPGLKSWLSVIFSFVDSFRLIKSNFNLFLGKTEKGNFLGLTKRHFFPLNFRSSLQFFLDSPCFVVVFCTCYVEGWTQYPSYGTSDVWKGYMGWHCLCILTLMRSLVPLDLHPRMTCSLSARESCLELMFQSFICPQTHCRVTVFWDTILRPKCV